MRQPIDIDRATLEDFCRKHGILRLALFGSILREDFGPTSDIDVLVEFQPGRTPGYFGLFAMEDELSQILRHPKIDLRTAEELSQYFRDEVLATARVLYDAA